MRIFGIDMTSAPSSRKPITCAELSCNGDLLAFVAIHRWRSFDPFDAHLHSPGPWVTGVDAPFAQSRTLVENLEWPESWSGYVERVGAMSKKEFRATLDAYKAERPDGQKHHKRVCDARARSQSPQTTSYTPVGLMFYEVAPRLLRSPVRLPHLRELDEERIVLEAYPGVMVRSLIGPRTYKSDTKKNQTPDRARARKDVLRTLVSHACKTVYGFQLDAPMSLADDPTGDDLDALLCAVQAAWGWSGRNSGFGAPGDVDPLEGWICDPALLASSANQLNGPRRTTRSDFSRSTTPIV